MPQVVLVESVVGQDHLHDLQAEKQIRKSWLTMRREGEIADAAHREEQKRCGQPNEEDKPAIVRDRHTKGDTDCELSQNDHRVDSQWDLESGLRLRECHLTRGHRTETKQIKWDRDEDPLDDCVCRPDTNPEPLHREEEDPREGIQCEEPKVIQRRVSKEEGHLADPRYPVLESEDEKFD
jgi:hypothetical protein